MPIRAQIAKLASILAHMRQAHVCHAQRVIFQARALRLALYVLRVKTKVRQASKLVVTVWLANMQQEQVTQFAPSAPPELFLRLQRVRCAHHVQQAGTKAVLVRLVVELALRARIRLE